jgi:hypothetical protein
MPLTQIGSHEVQAILTVSLLVATSLLALLCDFLRYRMYRPSVAVSREPARTLIAPTLVPEIEVPVRQPRLPSAEPVRGNQTARLAAAMHRHQEMTKKSGVRRAS